MGKNKIPVLSVFENFTSETAEESDLGLKDSNVADKYEEEK